MFGNAEMAEMADETTDESEDDTRSPWTTPMKSNGREAATRKKRKAREGSSESSTGSSSSASTERSSPEADSEESEPEIVGVEDLRILRNKTPESSDEEEEEEELPRNKTPRQAKQMIVEMSDEDELPRKSAQGISKSRKISKKSEEDVPLERSRRNLKKTVVLPEEPSRRKTRAQMKQEDTDGEAPEPESHTLSETTPPPKPRRILKRHPRKQSESLEVLDDDEAEQNAEELHSRKRKAQSTSPEQSTDDDVAETKTPRRRLTRKKNQRLDFQEQEDLQEDLEWLKSSPQPERKARPVMNARQKAMEEYKRRRQAKLGGPSSTAPVASGPNDVIELSDSESEEDMDDNNEQEGSDQVDEEDEEDESEEEQGVNDEEDEEVQDAHSLFRENQTDKDFIVEDDGALGVPDMDMDIPVEFSSLARAKSQTHFRYVIEWMVQKVVHPGFEIGHPYYKFSFDKLETELRGLGNSKFQSSVWRPDFVNALLARPNIEITEIIHGRLEVLDQNCEACNRTGHPATFEARFTGNPYDAFTLDDLPQVSEEEESSSSSSSESSSDSDSEDESESEARPKAKKAKPQIIRDSKRNILEPESRVFALGRTCKKNAHMAHILQHWRYHLFSWVKDYLAKKGYCTAEKIEEREGWKTKKLNKYAKKVVRKMDETGEIDSLHKLYKGQLKYAEDAQNDSRYRNRR